MPALVPTEHVGTLTWLGIVRDRGQNLRAAPVTALDLTFAGPAGDAHAGLVRRACSRVTAQHRKGTVIRNTRQVSIVAEEELADIARSMGLARLDPALLGATAVIAGIPDFTHLPPSSRLQDEDSGATVVIDMENLACVLPGREIEAEAPGTGARFKTAARGRRGVTAWVEREGRWRIGARLRLHVPAQRPWRGGAAGA